MRFSLFFSALIISLTLSAQNRYAFKAAQNIPVTISGDTLPNAWAGGLNYPSFASLDLNGDNQMDLIVYDRSKRKAQVYLATLRNGEVTYRYDPERTHQLPFQEIGLDFILTADFTCDGLQDVFVGDGNSIRAYENTSDANQTSFQVDPNGNPILANFPSSGINPIDYPGTDLPAIGDVDLDGDIDILAYGNGNTRVLFYENISANHCGLDLKLTESCWGKFTESGRYRSTDLSSCRGGNKRKTESVLHAGSTMAMADLNQDSLVDLLLGNVEFGNISALYNGGSADTALITSQDTLYPAPDPIDFQIFIAPYLADASGDNIPDLIASSYSSSSSGSPASSSNYQGIWYYENLGQANNPDFRLRQKDFLQSSQIEIGGNTVPRLVDINGDSLQDLVLSTGNRFDPAARGGLRRSQFYLFENVGSAAAPAFQMVDTNFADMLALNLGEQLVPTFGDLDNDGDLDMIVGTVSGFFHLFTNEGTATNPDFKLTTPLLTNTDLGANAAPFLYDIDEDGDLDLFVGSNSGKVAYFENTGDSSSAQFSLVNDFFGAIDVSTRLQGESIPVLFRDSSGTTMFVGSNLRGVIQYEQVDTLTQLPAQVNGAFGTGNIQSANSDESPFGIAKRSGHNQILIRSSELVQEGFLSGFIESLAFEVTDNGGATITNGITVRMANVSDSSLNTFHQQFPQGRAILDKSVSFGNGWNTIALDRPFRWDGQSNVLIDLCFSGNFTGANIRVAMSSTSFPSHAYGDITGFNTINADGCAMPYETSQNKRPNLRITLTPAAEPLPSAENPNLFAGTQAAPAVADLDDDGFLDVLLGNSAGGLELYRGERYPVSLPESPSSKPGNFSLFPNPSTGPFTLQQNPHQEPFESMRVINTQGQVVHESKLSQTTEKFNLSHLPPGLYLVHLQSKRGRATQRLLLR